MARIDLFSGEWYFGYLKYFQRLFWLKVYILIFKVCILLA